MIEVNRNMVLLRSIEHGMVFSKNAITDPGRERFGLYPDAGVIGTPMFIGHLFVVLPKTFIALVSRTLLKNIFIGCLLTHFVILFIKEKRVYI